MFQDEARVGVLLHHPNVCETYEIAEVKGIHYLAMEWVDGASLLRVLRPPMDADDGGSGSVMRAAIDVRVAARIVSDACAGLHAAHELVDEQGQPMKLVHRDATPHNILITADGRVKLSDFGVAKAMGNAHATLAGQIKGKMSYMAPEQLCGDPLDRRADIFAMGVCLYESIAGRKAFTGDSDPEVMSAIILGQIEPPSAYAGNIPPELEAIVMRAMGLTPADRYQTAWEMHEAIERFLATSGPPVGPADVAAVLESRCGKEIHERRDTIRLACSDEGLSEAHPASEPPTEIFVKKEESSSTRSVRGDRPPPNFWDEPPPHSAGPPPISHAGSAPQPYGYPPHPSSSQSGPVSQSGPYGYGAIDFSPPPPSVGHGGAPITVRNPNRPDASGSTQTVRRPGFFSSNTNVILFAAGVAAFVGVVGVVIAVLVWRRANASVDAPEAPVPAQQVPLH